MTGVNSAATASVAIASAIETLMEAAYGGTVGGTDFATGATAGVVAVTSGTAGVALPAITITGTAAAGATLSYKATSGATANPNTANVEASAYVAASTFAVPASALTATLAADKQISATASKTTDVTATAGTKATITTAKDVTVTSTGGATVKSAVGAVKVTEKGTAGSAVVVEGGTTVSVTKTGSSSTGTAYAGDITIGAAASYSNKSVSTDGYPEIDANVAKQPTGNVTINNGTSWTSTTGQANKTFGTGAATVYANGATTVSVATAGAITVQDVQVTTRKATIDATSAKGTQTLSSVTIEGSNAAASVTSDVLTSAKVINTGASAAVTITNATAAGHAMALTLGNNTAGTAVTDDTATSVTITTEAQSISTAANASAANVDLNAAKAPSLTFNNSTAVTLTTGATAGTTTLNGATKVTSITLTGSATAALGAIADATKLTKIDGSAATGAVTVTLPATTTTGGMAFTSGSGKDVVTVAGALASSVTSAGATITTTIALGEGNDTVKFSSGSIGAGASVDGGAGTDTIAAALLNAGNSAVITNFEVLGLDLGAVTYDTNLLVGATGLELLAPLGTYTNVEQAQSLTVNADVGTTATTLTFTAADVVGTADNYSVTFGAKGATASTLVAPTSIDAGTLVIEGIENVTIASNQASGYVNNTIDLTSANLKTVTITGAATQTTLGFAGVNGTNSGTAGVGGAVSSIDGSAATGAISVNTTNVVANSSSTGLTIKTGAGADTITLVGQKATVEAGDGADVITVAATFGGKLTGGAGADSFNVEAAVATGVTEATAVLTTITDLAAKDKVKLLAAATSFTSTKVAVTATTLEGAIGQAAATANVATWFQYGGDTYIVRNKGDTVLSTGDLVIKVTGLVTLTNSTLDTTTDYLTIV
jgi:S-layer protein